MSLAIETFDNVHGGNIFFKAITHPLAAEKTKAFLEEVAWKGAVAIYDPLNLCAAFNQIYDLKSLPIVDYFVQNAEELGKALGAHRAAPVSEIGNCKAPQLVVAAFDSAKFVEDIRSLLPVTIEITSFDQLRLPNSMLTDPRRYLSQINFATNYAFFRESGGHHTRLTTVNYWGRYGAKKPALWCRIYDDTGKVLAEWEEELGAPGSIVILDSHDIQARFALPDFTGQLFIHAVGIAGHDVVKYTLDIYGDEAHVLSCTHDANSWPADFYAGLPGPDAGEEVILWVQNSHAIAIPPDEVGLNVMGVDNVVRLSAEIPAFGTFRLNVDDLLKDVRWPQQIEITAGKYFVRPRYEISTKLGRQRISHVNVQRTDLRPDPKIATLSSVMGKGFLVAAPVMPVDRFSSMILPTPMATEQKSLPLAALIYDASGNLLCELRLGNLPRNHTTVVDITSSLKDTGRLNSGFGHVELIYDFSAGTEVDGWLHALFRYVDCKTGHIAETNFGSHIFNTVLTYKNEPQSYSHRPPGLSTRLFLRIGDAKFETFCHLIYPASTPWRETSSTTLTLFDCNGKELTQRKLKIPCSGSYLWRVHELFDVRESRVAENAYIVISDPTCRLFGYHGLIRDDQAFSLDHLFGF
jgi:hypothetical protein